MSATVGRMVPFTTLEATDGRVVRVRWGLQGTVIVLGVPDATDGVPSVVRAFDDADDALGRAKARAVVVARAGVAQLASAVSLPVVDDGEGKASDALGLDPGNASVVVVDQYGEVWSVDAPTEASARDSMDEALRTARFIGMQCPECEVPDAPDERLSMEGVHRWK